MEGLHAALDLEKTKKGNSFLTYGGNGARHMGKRGVCRRIKKKVTADELYAGISETWGKTVADIYGERGLARIKRKTRQNPAPWPKHMRQHGRACDKRRAHGA